MRSLIQFRVLLIVAVIGSFALSYSFAAIPAAPQAGDPACVNRNCLKTYYWWSGEADTMQCRYKNFVLTSEALVQCWCEYDTGGQYVQLTDTATKYLPSATKRTCNGAVGGLEHLIDDTGNVNHATMSTYNLHDCQ